MNLASYMSLWLTEQGILHTIVRNPNNVAANLEIQYDSSVTKEQIAAVEAFKLTFQVPPDPDLMGFVNDINADKLVQGQPLLFQLGANLLPILQMDMQAGNVKALKQHWIDVKSVFKSTWLTGDVISMIEGYAKTRGIPLI